MLFETSKLAASNKKQQRKYDGQIATELEHVCFSERPTKMRDIYRPTLTGSDLTWPSDEQSHWIRNCGSLSTYNRNEIRGFLR